MAEANDDRESWFLSLHMPHQRRIFGYLVSLVRDFGEAENLQQEVAIEAWKGLAAYDPAKPYLPWVFGIVRHVVSRHFREKQKAANCLPLDVAESVAAAMDEREEDMARERALLTECVQKLPDRHRELIRYRYDEGLNLGDIARRLASNLGAVNVMLCRIREALLRCVARAASREGLA